MTVDSPLLPQMFEQGAARKRLSPASARALATLYDEATVFFAKPDGEKLLYSVEGYKEGYRPFGAANTGSSYKTDLNDSFVAWKFRRALIPGHGEIVSFLDAVEAYQKIVAQIVQEFLEELYVRYDYPYRLEFEGDSLVQVNSFLRPADRELYQFSHEDCDLLTVIWGSAAGLEATGPSGEGAEPIVLGPDEVLVMPGSILTLMTGGEVRPFYHQVRNHNIRDRKSIMYFVCPDATGPVEPFRRGACNEGVDLQRVVQENPSKCFGLSREFVPSAR